MNETMTDPQPLTNPFSTAPAPQPDQPKKAKSKIIDLSSADLAAYLASKICHDIISPVGAIQNGLEVLDDKENPEMHDFALDLIRKSAHQASIRLQFARMAYGASGAAGSELDLEDAGLIAKQMFENEKTTLSWSAPKALVHKPKVKLILNLLLIAQASIPRGGEISVTVEGTSPDISFTITAKGKNSRLPQPAGDFLNDTFDGDNVDAHNIQPYYTRLMAQEGKMSLQAEATEEHVIFEGKSL
jgi:histidine phosphotransferase ChpT